MSAIDFATTYRNERGAIVRELAEIKIPCPNECGGLIVCSIEQDVASGDADAVAWGLSAITCQLTNAQGQQAAQAALAQWKEGRA
jgi:hypothetical protein